MTPELKNVIENLSQNTKKLMGLHNESLAENLLLKKEIKALIEKIEAEKKEKEEIMKKYESLKLAKVIAASSTESHDAKIKLNRIVREIDKCISLLNK